jgi:hypothetical protein
MVHPKTLQNHYVMTIHVRQGDVLLMPVDSMPEGCELIPDVQDRIILAYGEVTGHAHAIADHITKHRQSPQKYKAGLYRHPSGMRYLHVIEPVTLQHEEHTAHAIPAGFYMLPTQVEYTPAELQPVID